MGVKFLKPANLARDVLVEEMGGRDGIDVSVEGCQAGAVESPGMGG